MTALLSVPIYQKISLTSKVMEKKYCFIVCCHAILISSQLSLHGLVIKYHELHGFRINSKAVIGKNVNIHKGVTIGQENRGIRKGTPTIGNNVWIGINSTIVGKITIGDDVLIAPNAFVNTDIPSHSIVIGNPCIIKSCENATKDYINNPVP